MTRITRSAIPFLVLAALAVLAGCASQKPYYHPKKPQSVWEADLEHCRINVEELYYTGRLIQPDIESGIEHCMRAKGYVYGHDPHPEPEAASRDFLDTSETEFSILESAYHTQDLAEKRRQYLLKTGVRGVFLRAKDLGSEGLWFWVMIGSYETLDSARQHKEHFFQNFGLHNLRIVKQDSIL